jgi:nucleotide-binding universal stress UspA family protein
MRKIVVPVDFSTMTEDVLEMAKLFAGTFTGELYLIHVIQTDPALIGYLPEPRELHEPVPESCAKVYFSLQEQARQLRYAGYRTFPCLIEGEIVDAILKKARSVEAELIIMGAHNKGALSRIFLGSVSEGVLRRARCPVMVIPAGSSKGYEHS